MSGRWEWNRRHNIFTIACRVPTWQASRGGRGGEGVGGEGVGGEGVGRGWVGGSGAGLMGTGLGCRRFLG